MAFSFYMPDIGEGVVEGEIVAWKVKEGDRVKLDQPIVEVMTDKATVELPAPRAGTITKIHYKDGQICPVGQILVVIEEDAGAAATADAKAAGTSDGKPEAKVDAKPEARAEAKPEAKAEAKVDAKAKAKPEGRSDARPEPKPPARSGNGHGAAAAAARQAPPSHAPAVSASPAPARATPGAPGAIAVVDATEARPRVLATPATRRLARQLGVELTQVPPSGQLGRVTSDDVRGFHANGGAAVHAAAPARAFAPQAIAVGGDEERIPLRGIRKRISESMARSVHTAAHFTYVEEIDMTELVAVRERAKARAAERGVKLHFLPFLVKAAVSGLKKWPQLNASLDETTQEIVRKKYYHIGIAAQGPQGLAVSVVRDADRRSIFDLAREIERLGDAVRTGTATREDLTGSTFTITSLGKLGGLHATPIINFPEVAIVGVHKIEERAVVRAGQIVARHMMNLSISVDHRLADGWDGAMFLQEVKALLEDPTTMFMEMI
ncbi:MAG TPA: dihydrolipoamide acetyltransferase family protein [Kofleriaceae bacterium]|nr:dihydrolipoamide acetyltransferase family protein [Kofleriaceae bacterium]